MTSSVMLSEARSAARRFKPDRATHTISRLWDKARRMDVTAVRAAAEVAAEELRQAGLDGVRIED